MQHGEVFDVLAAGDDGPRRGEQALAALGVLRRRHSRSIVVTVLMLAIVGAAAYGWVRAHPGPLPVPDLEVRATGASAFVDGAGAGASGATVRGSLLIRLALTVRTRNRSDEVIQFLGLSGAGFSSLASPPRDLGPADSVAVEAPTRIQCEEWNGLAGTKARFRLVRGGRTRDVEVPVNPRAEFEVTTAIQRPCALYNATHPLRVVGVVETLDRELPIVHLKWTLRNPTNLRYVIGSAGAFSDRAAVTDVLAGLEPGQDPSSWVPPHGESTLLSTLVIADCTDPHLLDLAGQTFTLHGEAENPSRSALYPARSVQVDLPDAPMEQAAELGRRACEGAPLAVADGVRATAGGRGTEAGVITSVAGQLTSRSGSGSAPGVAIAGLRVWLASDESYLSGETARPLGGGAALTDATGRFSLSHVPSASGCPGEPESTATLRLRLIVKGLREYPYQVTIGSLRMSETSCVVAHRSVESHRDHPTDGFRSPRGYGIVATTAGEGVRT